MTNQYEGVSTAAAGMKHFRVKVTTRRLIWDPGTQIPGPGLDFPVLPLVGEGGRCEHQAALGQSLPGGGVGDGLNTRQLWDSLCLVGVGVGGMVWTPSSPGTVLAWWGWWDGVNTRQPGTILDLQARVCRFSMALPTANCRALRKCLDLSECGFLHSES